MTFSLHPQLARDFHAMASHGDCRLLLRRNALIPWYIIVPEAAESELHLLPEAQRARVYRLSERLAAFVKERHGSARVNVAAIGNMVPQLHLHVVGRSPGDPCWPGVVWGALPDGPDWTGKELVELRRALALLAV